MGLLSNLPVIGAVAEIQNLPAFKAAVKDVKSSLQDVGGAASDMGGSVASGSEVASTALSALGTVAFAVVTVAAAAATAAIAAFVTATVAIVAHGVEVNATLEQTGIQLQALTGLGQENLNWAKQMSVTTPFTPQSVTNALQMAYAYGFTGAQAKDLVTAAGNVSAAFGDQGDRMHRIIIALGQMQGAAKVNAQDMKQLTEAGVNAWQLLADHVGVSVGEIRQLVTDGMISTGEAVQVITKGIQDKFQGSMERASNSVIGAMGNIQNLLDIASADIATPVFDAIEEVLKGVRDEMKSSDFQDLVADIKELVVALSENIDASQIIGFFKGLIGGAKEALDFIKQLRAELSGMSAEDILAQGQAAVAKNEAAYEDSLNRLATAHDSVIAGINSDMTDASAKLARGLADVDDKYADKEQSITDRMQQAASDFNDSMAKTARDLARRLEDNQYQLNERLESLAQSHADRIKSINQSVANENINYDQRNSDIHQNLQDDLQSSDEKFEKDREALQEKLNAATTDAEREAITQQIAALEEQHAEEDQKIKDKAARDQARLDEDHKRALDALAQKKADEDAAYAEDVKQAEEKSARDRARIQEDNAYAVQELKDRLAKENADLDAQMAKVEADKAKEKQQLQTNYDGDVKLLQDRIAQENAAYDQQRADTLAKRDADDKKALDDAQELADKLGTGPAHQIATIIGTIRDAAIKIVPTVVDAVSHYDWNNVGHDIGYAIGYGLTTAVQWVYQKAVDVLEWIANAVKDKDWLQIGGDIIRGLAQGIWDLSGWLYDQIVQLIQGLLQGARDAAASHSPSEKAALIGETFPEGMGLGILRKADFVYDAMNKVLQNSFNLVPAYANALAASQAMPNVVVQAGQTVYDQSVSVNANYQKTQDPSTIRHDLQLASMLRRS